MVGFSQPIPWRSAMPSERFSTGCAGFGNVDQSGDARRLMDYLRAVTDHPLLVAWRSQRMELARVAPGECVLDIGCGIGIETLALAKAVAPGGNAVGVDL